MGMSTVRSGSALSVTVTTAEPPSGTEYDGCSNDTATDGTSSSVIETTVSLVVPADTRSGSVPKASLTLSPSSSTVSCGSG